MNTNTSTRCVSSTGGQQSPINFQTVGNDTLDFTDILELTGSSEEGKSQGRLVFSENLWCVRRTRIERYLVKMVDENGSQAVSPPCGLSATISLLRR
jgi:hypothetical protein